MCAQRTTANKWSSARETDTTRKELGCCLPRLCKICKGRQQAKKVAWETPWTQNSATAKYNDDQWTKKGKYLICTKEYRARCKKTTQEVLRQSFRRSRQPTNEVAREIDTTRKELGCCLPRLRKICAHRTATSQKNGPRDTVDQEFNDCQIQRRSVN